MTAYTTFHGHDKSSAFSPFRQDVPDKPSCPGEFARYPIPGYYSAHYSSSYLHPSYLSTAPQSYHPEIGYIPLRDAASKAALLSHHSSVFHSNAMPGMLGYHCIEEEKPSQSYIGLIGKAILSAPQKKLILSDIYNYILAHYPYFRNKGPGWRNSIRHNLSLNECFVKIGRSPNGKGHFWAINPSNYEDFSKGEYRRKRASKKRTPSASSNSSENFSKTCEKHIVKRAKTKSQEDIETQGVDLKIENTGLLAVAKLENSPNTRVSKSITANRGFHIETLLSGLTN